MLPVKQNNWTGVSEARLKDNLVARLEYLCFFNLNEASEGTKFRYRLICMLHTVWALVILLASIAYFILDNFKNPDQSQSTIWHYIITPLINMIAAIIGLISTKTCHKYSTSHRFFALFHCLALGVMVIKSIEYLIFMSSNSQNYFTNMDPTKISIYWRSIMGWLGVGLMYVMVINELLVLSLAYTLGNLGFFFFFIAFLLGKYVPL